MDADVFNICIDIELQLQLQGCVNMRLLGRLSGLEGNHEVIKESW
jgi:hypothetical protein